MADVNKIVADCVDGDFFVDTTCINCDTCRQLAPSVFADQGDFSYVKKQPVENPEIQAANRALLCCPTGSIGSTKSRSSKDSMNDFPLLLEENLFYCGFNSRKSYGANSYFLKHEKGNWLIDSPRYVPHLVKAFAAMGGIKYIFLTHRDDVADCDRYAKEFGAKRIIHQDDLDAAPEAELVIQEETSFLPGFKLIPVPGHTKGHMVLLVEDRYLFTGDHLAYDPDSKELIAFRNACWYSWKEQRISMQKLIDLNFEWVLAGHGDRVHLPKTLIQEKLLQLIEHMK